MQTGKAASAETNRNTFCHATAGKLYVYVEVVQEGRSRKEVIHWEMFERAGDYRPAKSEVFDAVSFLQSPYCLDILPDYYHHPVHTDRPAVGLANGQHFFGPNEPQ